MLHREIREKHKVGNIVADSVFSIASVGMSYLGRIVTQPYYLHTRINLEKSRRCCQGCLKEKRAICLRARWEAVVKKRQVELERGIVNETIEF
jgi:hypothetical protein